MPIVYHYCRSKTEQPVELVIRAEIPYNFPIKVVFSSSLLPGRSFESPRLGRLFGFILCKQQCDEEKQNATRTNKETKRVRSLARTAVTIRLKCR